MSNAARKLESEDLPEQDALEAAPDAGVQDDIDALFDAPAPELTDEEAADALLGPLAGQADKPADGEDGAEEDGADDLLDQALAGEDLAGGLSPDDDPTEGELEAAKARAEADAAAAALSSGDGKSRPKIRLKPKASLKLPKRPSWMRLPKLPKMTRAAKIATAVLALGYIALAAAWAVVLWPYSLDEHGLPPRLTELGSSDSEILRGPRGRLQVGQTGAEQGGTGQLGEGEAAPDDGIRLVPAPAEDLYEVTPAGLLLPKTGPGLGDTAFRRYARPFDAPPGTPLIAVIMTGLGRDAQEAEQVIPGLPREITLSFVPYAEDLDRILNWSRNQHGHEAVLSVPMEPLDYGLHDPGPDTLLANSTAGENIDRLHLHMAGTAGYVGMMQHMGSAMATRSDALRPVMEELERRGLAFIDSGTNPDSVAGNLALRMTLPFGVVQSKIDESPQPRAIRESLQKLEAEARRNGTAIGVAEPYRITLDELRRWAPALQRRGIRLAPLSAVLLQRQKDNRPQPRFEP
ncbi:MAG: hypothetical protein Alpg2KO_06080 [Alphaproteobacteria bacterium]